MPRLEPKVVRVRNGTLIRRLVLLMVLVGLLAACDLQPPDGSLPDVSLPDVSLPEETVPEETVPEETVPEETVPEETVPDEEGEVSPWLWIVLAAGVIALLVGALTRNSKARSAAASWTERTRSALLGLESIEATLGRPATLDPTDHESVRRSIASARDQSVTFEQLAKSAPDQTLAQHAAATADALRVLATTSEIEVEGLASGTLSTVASREAAESERRVHLQALHQAAERLTRSLQ